MKSRHGIIPAIDHTRLITVKLDTMKTLVRIHSTDTLQLTKDIILYTYPGCNQDFGEVPPDPTHEPIPSTLKKLFIWGNWQYANVCPHSESLQENFYIYHEPEGVFFGIDDIIDSQEAYESDMAHIVECCDKDH